MQFPDLSSLEHISLERNFTPNARQEPVGNFSKATITRG